jgi:hypothetical protein
VGGRRRSISRGRGSSWVLGFGNRGEQLRCLGAVGGTADRHRGPWLRRWGGWPGGIGCSGLAWWPRASPSTPPAGRFEAGIPSAEDRAGQYWRSSYSRRKGRHGRRRCEWPSALRSVARKRRRPPAPSCLRMGWVAATSSVWHRAAVECVAGKSPPFFALTLSRVHVHYRPLHKGPREPGLGQRSCLGWFRFHIAPLQLPYGAISLSRGRACWREESGEAGPGAG